MFDLACVQSELVVDGVDIKGGVLAVDPLLQLLHSGPHLVECLHLFGGQRPVQRDEQLLRERIGQTVDAVVVERSGQVLWCRNIVVGCVAFDDEDNLVGDGD